MVIEKLLKYGSGLIIRILKGKNLIPNNIILINCLKNTYISDSFQSEMMNLFDHEKLLKQQIKIRGGQRYETSYFGLD